jgi:polyisoprenoid-binding protein YceI
MRPLRVRAFLAFAALLAAAPAARAQATLGARHDPASWGLTRFNLDTAHSSVNFRVRHLGISWVHGQFKEYSLDLQYDPASPERSSVTTRIRTASVDTRNERRDADLRSPRFLASDSFPEMVFTSRSVERVAPGRLRIHGDLTIKGVTRAVSLDCEVGGTFEAPRRGQGGAPAGTVRRVAFTATTTIDRTHWGLTFSPIAEGVRAAGDEVHITIEVEATATTG